MSWFLSITEPGARLENQLRSDLLAGKHILNSGLNSVERARTAHQIITFLTLAIVIPASPLLAIDCPVDHCSKVSKEVNHACIKAKRAGKWVYVDYMGYKCDCPCSCFASGTPISAKGGAATVEQIGEEDFLQTPGGTTQVAHAILSSVENYPVLNLAFDGGREITITHNHALIDTAGMVTAAADVKLGDRMLSETGHPVSVTSVRPSIYTGTLHNFILNGVSLRQGCVISRGQAATVWF